MGRKWLEQMGKFLGEGKNKVIFVEERGFILKKDGGKGGKQLKQD